MAVLLQQESKLYTWGGGLGLKLLPEFQGANSAMQASIGQSHFAVVTHTRKVFTWNSAAGISAQDGHSEGQLGHGTTASFRQPKEVAQLQSESVSSVHCGDEFTTFVTENGRVLVCGSNYDGCMGNGDNGSGLQAATEVQDPSTGLQTVPREITFFTSRPVRQLSCGPRHIVALTAEGIYSWGCGEMGRLGHGTEDDASAPTRVLLPPKADIVSIVCGADATVFRGRQGLLYACGNNEHNKLALDMQVGVLHSRRQGVLQAQCEAGMSPGVVVLSLVPNLVRGLRDKVVAAVSVGATHMACVDSAGRLYCCGNNDYGQLGLGHTKPQLGPVRATTGVLADAKIRLLCCGEDFTLAVGGFKRTAYPPPLRVSLVAPCLPSPQLLSRLLLRLKC